MEAVLLLDEGDLLPRWQIEAIQEAIRDGLKLQSVLRCTNSRRRIDRRKWAYYGFALASRRGMPELELMDASHLWEGLPQVRFDSQWEGAWQRIPAGVSAQLSQADVMLKFGMGLLRDPEDLPVKHGVLSYHHGDPRRYRGRPAGFYEMLEGASEQGIIVQSLSNVLDGGRVLASTSSPVVSYSYATTLGRAYRAGVPLLTQALRNLEYGLEQPRWELGRNYRLPATRQVARASARMLAARMKRYGYGALREKRWRVGSSPPIPKDSVAQVTLSNLQELPLPKGCTFVADPFPTPDGRLVFAEVMEAKSGLGRLGRWDGGEWSVVALPGVTGHLSYPFTFVWQGRNILLPEIARHSAPQLFAFDSDWKAVVEVIPMEGLKHERIRDPTILESEGTWYLFGNRALSPERLDLWAAPSPTGPWAIHPSSPLVAGVLGSRMAGAVRRDGSSLLRYGQVASEKYGTGVSEFAIEELTPTTYRESFIRKLQLGDVFGPHTYNVDLRGTIWLDYFTEKTTPLAGVRRARALMAR